jgi:hypothetical protein
MLGALRVPGSPAVMTGEGATESEVFRPSVQQVLGPRLVPGDVVVLDNLGGPQAVGIQPRLARRRAR